MPSSDLVSPVEENALEFIRTACNILARFHACTTDEQITAQLQSVSEKSTQGGETGWYCLMKSLDLVVRDTLMSTKMKITISSFLSKASDVQSINRLIPAMNILYHLKKLIAACKTPEQITALLQGLSEKRISNGETGLYCLMRALSSANEKGFEAVELQILDVISQVIATCRTPEQITLLLQGLSQKKAKNNQSGLYCLMYAFHDAIFKNSVTVIKFSNVINQLIDACKTPEQITQLLQGLCEKRHVDHLTGLYCLTAASLYTAALKNSVAASSGVLEAIDHLIAACKTPQQITGLLQGLSEKVTVGNHIGRTGWYWWIRALAISARGESSLVAAKTAASLNQLVKAYFSQNDFSNTTNVIEWMREIASLPSDYKNKVYESLFAGLENNKHLLSSAQLIALKKELRHPLRDYLKTADLKMLLSSMNGSSVLTALIACRTDNKTHKHSGTQEWIQERIKEVIEKRHLFLSFSTLFSRVKSALTSPDKNKLLFETLIKWLENLADLKLLSEIEEQLTCAVSSPLIDEINRLVYTVRSVCPVEVTASLTVPGIAVAFASTDSETPVVPLPVLGTVLLASPVTDSNTVVIAVPIDPAEIPVVSPGVEDPKSHVSSEPEKKEEVVGILQDDFFLKFVSQKVETAPGEDLWGGLTHPPQPLDQPQLHDDRVGFFSAQLAQPQAVLIERSERRSVFFQPQPQPKPLALSVIETQRLLNGVSLPTSTLPTMDPKDEETRVKVLASQL